VTDPATTNVQLGDGWPIALDDGSYTLTVTQSVTPAGDTAHTFSRNFEINIVGPRYSIAPADLHSCFPPPGGTGSYAALLPQVVLARATLPWERTLTGSATAGAGLPTPFVAVLVVDGAGAPPTTGGTFGDLLNPPSDVVGPQLTPQTGESLSDACMYVDMPGDVFAAAAPTEGDLGYLAHIRQVDVTSKALGESPADGWFAVVIANRLPAIGDQSTAYLVSLESLSGYLPPNRIPAGKTKIRLAVLTSWTFTDNGQSEQQFTTSLKNLTTGGLSVPPPSGGSGPGQQAAAAALELGYVPMNHGTRQGENLVSWYRGPLVPLSMADPSMGTMSSSDAALRFDPSTGMLDVAYATAWQLGRLMALGDREVALAIYQWRRAHVQRAVRLAGRIMLARRFPSLGLEPTVAGLLRPHAVRRSVAALLATEIGAALLGGGAPTAPTERRRGSLQPPHEHKALVGRLRADPYVWLGLAAHDQEPVPAVVKTWLDKLAKLRGIPFNHLVPDPRALPVESIRFFCVDPAWMAALVDGALSLGRTTSVDAEHDAAVAPLVTPIDLISGFLIRSTVVDHWRGVEVDVYSDAAGTDPLPIIRLERLAANVLLCLAGGLLQHVTFRQPTEGLQFGVFDDNDLHVELRGLGQGGFTVGQDLGATAPLSWSNQANRVLDMAGSAGATGTVTSALAGKSAWPLGTPLGAGDFALELLESSQVVQMTVAPAASPPLATLGRPPEDLLADGAAALQAFVERELADGR
jgi:hypothetical protein